MEVLDQILDTELLELGSLEFIAIDEEVNHVFVVYVLHERVLAKVLETVKNVGIGQAEQVERHSMVEVLNRAGVQVLHHVEVTGIAPVLDLNLGLGAFFHSVHEHASEVFALGG